ncbi:MAG: NfeD family protein [Erysipelotrichaceae bacterium]|nr:NfeD family protein [Erysipelotrichaceae bacterium]
MYTYLWIIVLIAAIVLEFITASSLVSLWFACGAIVSLILSSLKIPFIYQAITFFIISLSSLLIIRPMIIDNKRGNTIATNMDRFIGKHTRLKKSITEDSWGEVRIDGITWNVASIDEKAIEKNSLVEVIAIEGSKLIVKQIKEDI